MTDRSAQRSFQAGGEEWREAGSSGRSGLAQYVALLRRFFRPHWRASVAVAVLYVGAGMVKALEPLAFAPAVHLFTKESPLPAASLRDLSLNNLAPSMLHWFGMESVGNVGILLFSVLAYVSIAVLSSALGLGAFMLMIRGRTMIERDMLTALHGHLLTLPFGYFVNKSSGDFVSRLSNDVSQTAQTMDAATRGMLQAVAETMLYGYVLFRTDYRLAAWILLLGSLHFAVTRLFSVRAKMRTKMEFKRKGTVSHFMLETLSGLRVIKSFSAERYDAKRIAQVAEDFRVAVLRARRIMYVEVPVRHIATVVISCMALTLAFREMEAGRLAGGGFVLFVAVAMRALGPVASFSQHLLHLNAMLGGAERILEVLETRNTLEDGEAKPARLTDAIELRGVSFRYRPETVVLADIDLTIRKGETVALVGPSGGGKTTLMDLILRLYDPFEGKVTYDGVDIRTFKQRWYRRHFGVVAQDSFMFHTTVRENILLGRDEDGDSLAYALAAANAEGFVNALPRGLDTVCGARGIQLSGGQRQRIALARAIYGRPDILLLDEATSALDSESERAIQDALQRVTRDRTALIIAHRLSTVMHADRIVVLSGGRIEAEGRHEDLLRTSPTYSLLYNLQYNRAPTVEDATPVEVREEDDDDSNTDPDL